MVKTLADRQPILAPEWFVHELDLSLRHLYDPYELRRSQLVGLLGIAGDKQPVVGLRALLSEAIAALEPEPEMPPESNSWRFYEVLSQRYLEQFPQQSIADSLMISTRQLRRIQNHALQNLADRLWTEHSVDSKAPVAQGVGLEMPGLPESEMQVLQETYPTEVVDVDDVVRATLDVVQPLLDTRGVRVDLALDATPSLAMTSASLLRNALINVLTALASAPGEHPISLGVEHAAQSVSVAVCAQLRGQAGVHRLLERLENLDLASTLGQLSGGVVELEVPTRGETSVALRIVLPPAQDVGVLVIDDNEDALSLLDRFLAGSRYRFMGVSDPNVAIETAEHACPGAIILDIMYPDGDGWDLLGRLRAHPTLREVPVIISTILPQQDLALALGAVSLLKKPVTQESLLAELDRQLGPESPRCG